MMDPIIIRVHQHSEGGLEYDIWGSVDPQELYELASNDGGICTSGCETDKEMEKPYTREDYKNALEMATGQVLDMLFPNKG